MYNNKVDIILPVYNSKEFILETLTSINKQTYENWRLIIIDDCSKDGSEKLIENFLNNKLSKRKFIFIKNKKNKGQAFSRNFALKQCNAKFVAFIDSDDIWEKNKLKQQINFMIKYDYIFTYTDYKTVKNNKIKIIITPSFFNYKNFIKNTSIATSTMIIKNKFLKGITFPDLKLCEDYYFKCQILKLSDAYKCQGVYTLYRLRNNSLQSNRFRVLITLFHINKNLLKINLISNFVSILFIIINSIKKYAFR